MLKKLLLSFFIIFRIISPASSQNYSVQILNSGINELINSVHFCNDSEGYVTWQIWNIGGILKTSDGGANWYNTGTFPQPMRSVFFLNADTGFATGDGGIFKTTDGGFIWTNMTTGGFRSVYFTSADTGYAAGNFGLGMGTSKTTDGGNSWTNIFSQSATQSLFFTNPNVGYATQIQSPYTSFYKTTNAGTTWSTITIPGLTNGVASIYFTDADTGYVGEWEHGIYKTTDGGTTWTVLTLGTTFYLHAIHFLDANNGFAVGSNDTTGVILNTTDGGNTWSKLFLGYGTSVLTSVYFPDAKVGYVTGNLGTILKIQRVSTGLTTIKANSTFNVSPNPTSGNFTITFPSTINQGTITVTNTMGAKMFSQNIINTTTANIQLKNFAKGIYFVKINDGKIQFCEKIILN